MSCCWKLSWCFGLTFTELLFHPVEDSEGTLWLWLVCLACWSSQTEVSRTGLSNRFKSSTNQLITFQKRYLLVWTRMFINGSVFMSAGTSVLNQRGCMKYCTQASLSPPIIKTWRLPYWSTIRRSNGLLELFFIEHGFCRWGKIDFLSHVPRSHFTNQALSNVSPWKWSS